MKIAIDYGHNSPPDSGCSGLSPEFPREDSLTKTVAKKLHALLKANGHTTYDVTPASASSVSASLRARCDKANATDADYFLSIHFNCFNHDAHGTEQFAMSEKGRRFAQLIQNKLSALGFTNRGVKDGSHLYVVRNTNMPAVLAEVCFCDNRSDMRKFDADAAARAIMEAIEQL
jgi:N-acetylmuramoyl-L-alanine amidase